MTIEEKLAEKGVETFNLGDIDPELQEDLGYDSTGEPDIILYTGPDYRMITYELIMGLAAIEHMKIRTVKNIQKSLTDDDVLSFTLMDTSTSSTNTDIGPLDRGLNLMIDPKNANDTDYLHDLILEVERARCTLDSGCYLGSSIPAIEKKYSFTLVPTVSVITETNAAPKYLITYDLIKSIED